MNIDDFLAKSAGYNSSIHQTTLIGYTKLVEREFNDGFYLQNTTNRIHAMSQITYRYMNKDVISIISQYIDDDISNFEDELSEICYSKCCIKGLGIEINRSTSKNITNIKSDIDGGQYAEIAILSGPRVIILPANLEYNSALPSFDRLPINEITDVTQDNIRTLIVAYIDDGLTKLIHDSLADLIYKIAQFVKHYKF